MRDPDFLVVAAQKCGTTWLSFMLRQHPQVAVPDRKELHLFNEHDDRGLDWSRGQFSAEAARPRAGGFTSNYFWTSHVNANA